MLSQLALLASLAAFHPATPAQNADHAVVGQATAAQQGTASQAPSGTRQKLGENLYVIRGQGGNILFSTGPDGAFVVDDQYARNAAANLSLIEEVSETPVVFVLNTHFHGDHSGGNVAFHDAGATIVAHDNVRARLAGMTGDAARDPKALPAITFSEEASFHWNGDDIRVVHVPNAHTDGDAIVHFEEANVIHTGDTLFFGQYPYIDLTSGGTVSGVINALQKVAERADRTTQIVPGHGRVTDIVGLRQTIEMIRDARRRVKTAALKGMSREEVIASNPLKDLNDQYASDFIDGDRMTGQLFDDLAANDQDVISMTEALKRGETTSAEPVPETGESETEAAEIEVEADADSDGLAERLEAAKEAAGDALEKAKSRASEIIDDLTNGDADADAPAEVETEAKTASDPAPQTP